MSHDIDFEQAQFAMNKMLKGELDEIQLASFITLLRAKGETVEELCGLVNAMWDDMPEFSYVESGPTIDTCGTGGDNSNTFNISTAVAFALSAAGIKVAKHGNRAASSKCGAADVLEELGIRIDLSPDQCVQRLEETGFTFLFAPTFHSGMRYAAPVRKSLGIRTTFNFLGPLANPLKASYRMHGVSDPDIVEVYAKTLFELGVKNAFVFSGHSGLDEISLSGQTSGMLISGDSISIKTIDPKDIGIEYSDTSQLAGGDLSTNAQILLDIGSGELGPKRDIVILNAAVAYDLITGVGLVSSAEVIKDVIDSGKFTEKIEQLKGS